MKKIFFIGLLLQSTCLLVAGEKSKLETLDVTFPLSENTIVVHNRYGSGKVYFGFTEGILAGVAAVLKGAEDAGGTITKEELEKIFKTVRQTYGTNPYFQETLFKKVKNPVSRKQLGYEQLGYK
ncbi:hypothetical protein K9K77_01770 [Candidatus Babeliales bacterium]|nr:hypothetical protein [Candidatus Babeliales bacterium]